MGMERTLPLFELEIDDNTGVNFIALVDKPAIEMGWVAFAEQTPEPYKFAIVEDEHIVFGPAMVPDMQIYRKDESGEYLVKFTKDTIKKIAHKFFELGYQNNANAMHDPAKQLQGVTFFQSVIKDSSKGIIGMDGNYPDGTWFLGAKITDNATWEMAKSGKFTGFSIEGMFKYKKTNEQILQAIKAILIGI